jgi:membrane fusion protein, multidrug efflux system
MTYYFFHARERISLLFVLLAGLTISITSCGKKTEQDGRPNSKSEGRGGGKDRDRPATVSAVTVQPREFVDAIEAIGTARANESVQLTANVTDRIKSIRFADGQYVRKGQILVELFAQEETADLGQAKARLAEAQSQLTRVQALVKDGWATQSRLETQQAARDGARAAVASLEARVQDRFIRAPFSGIIGLRTISPGLVATSGTPIAEISDISQIKVDFTVPELKLLLIRQGMNIVAESGALLGQRFKGRINAVDPQIDPVTRAATMRAIIANNGGMLKPGMLLSVNVEQLRRQALSVPEQALVADGEQKSVFVINTQRTEVEKIPVTIGSRQPGFVEITGGIAPGTLIVADGTVKLRDGSKIKITSEKMTDEKQ